MLPEDIERDAEMVDDQAPTTGWRGWVADLLFLVLVLMLGWATSWLIFYATAPGGAP